MTTRKGASAPFLFSDFVYIENIWVIRHAATAPADDATIGMTLLHKDFCHGTFHI